jgi:hypothetical protein
MKAHVFVCLLLAGLALAAAGLSLGDPPKGRTPTDDKPWSRRTLYYARVELKGQLSATEGSLRLSVAEDEFQLDLSRLKEHQREAVRKLDGETIIVTGDLSFSPPPLRGGRGKPRVLVSSVTIR